MPRKCNSPEWNVDSRTQRMDAIEHFGDRLDLLL